jgi:hypothetical protein
MRRLALFIPVAMVAVAGCDSGTEPDLRPPHIVFTSVSAATGSPGLWRVPTSMRNEGGPGSFHVRFYAVNPDDPSSGEVICAFTDGISVDAGWRDTGEWAVPCQGRPLTIAVRSLQPATGEHLETDRASIPGS